MEESVIFLDNFNRDESKRKQQVRVYKIIGIVYLVIGIVYLWDKYFLSAALYTIAGGGFLFASAGITSWNLRKYIYLNNDIIEIKQSLFKRMKARWSEISSVKMELTAILIHKKDGGSITIPLDWIDYPVVKKIQTGLQNFCRLKNIQCK